MKKAFDDPEGEFTLVFNCAGMTKSDEKKEKEKKKRKKKTACIPGL